MVDDLYKRGVIGMRSIIQEEKRCYICGSTRWIEIHHVYGNAYRTKADRYGLTVPLCHECHNEPGGVHYNGEIRQKLQAHVQKKAMEHYGWTEDEFRSLFGQNYIL